MKLRIQDNSLRFRLTQKEVMRLKEMAWWKPRSGLRRIVRSPTL